MKRYSNFAYGAIAFALCGCDSETPGTVSGTGGAGGECVGLREQGQTCLSDCDCAGDLECAPCVSTAERNCVDVCAPNDPYCNYGTVTCPIGDGLPCESVTTCQAPAPTLPDATPCTTATDCPPDECRSAMCLLDVCTYLPVDDGTACTFSQVGHCIGGVCINQ